MSPWTAPASSPGPVAPAPPAYEATATAVTPAPARRARGARLLNVALAGAVALAIAGVAFAAGRLTAPAAVTAGGPNGGPGQVFGKDGQGIQNGGPNGRGAFLSGGPTIEGTVESITDTTLTLKTADGQTIQIALDGSTTYHAQTDASADDVAAGGKVLVRLDVGAAGAGGNGGPTASGRPTGPTASDVTVVP
jgi:hypothetical protein